MNDENMGNNEDWIAKAGDISQAVSMGVSKLLSTSTACKLCSMYVDEQVEFEKRQEDYKTNVAKNLLRTYQPTMEVELYRQFLFDEESVVESVTERDDADLNGFDRGYNTTRRLPYGDEGTVSTQKS